MSEIREYKYPKNHAQTLLAVNMVIQGWSAEAIRHNNTDQRIGLEPYKNNSLTINGYERFKIYIGSVEVATLKLIPAGTNTYIQFYSPWVDQNVIEFWRRFKVAMEDLTDKPKSSHARDSGADWKSATTPHVFPDYEYTGEGEIVEIFTWPGNIKNFKDTMEELQHKYPDGWRVPGTNELTLHFSDVSSETRARYSITAQFASYSDAHATLETFEKNPNETTVWVIDGYAAAILAGEVSHKRPKIGKQTLLTFIETIQGTDSEQQRLPPTTMIVYNEIVGGDKIEVKDVTEAAGVAIGRGASANVRQGLSGDELAKLFAEIRQQIEARPADPDVEKEERQETVDKID